MESTIISTLELSPSYIDETIALIEKSFNYQKSNSFEIDFYPLLKKSNHKNCYILIEENKVRAHIGALDLFIKINDKSIPVTFYGGICVETSSQGKGFFRKLFEFARVEHEQVAMSLLWSDQTQMYSKFSYSPALTQYQYSQSSTINDAFKLSSLKDLTSSELNQLKDIYNNAQEFRVERNNEHWEDIKKITSSDLYLKKENEIITNYFFMNKGEDLEGIIHEYGHLDEKSLTQMQGYGDVWTPQLYSAKDADSLFGALVKIENHELFNNLVQIYTDNKFKIEKIYKQLIHFEYLGNTVSMGEEEFLQGLLGPGSFEELGEIFPIYISGLDSI